jgi:hypothetical protein
VPGLGEGRTTRTRLGKPATELPEMALPRCARRQQAKGPHANQSRIEELLRTAQTQLRDLAPYEHPKLTAVKVSGDPNAPVALSVEMLSNLSDAELQLIRQVMVKIQQQHAEHGTSAIGERDRFGRIGRDQPHHQHTSHDNLLCLIPWS